MRGAADTLTPVVLELGGKDPMVITDDADIGQVAQIALRGTYQNCGQNCIGVERMFVYEAVLEDFIAKVRQGCRKGIKGGKAVTAAPLPFVVCLCCCGHLQVVPLVKNFRQGAPLLEEVDIGAMTMPESVGAQAIHCVAGKLPANAAFCLHGDAALRQSCSFVFCGPCLVRLLPPFAAAACPH